MGFQKHCKTGAHRVSLSGFFDICFLVNLFLFFVRGSTYSCAPVIVEHNCCDGSEKREIPEMSQE